MNFLRHAFEWIRVRLTTTSTHFARRDRKSSVSCNRTGVVVARGGCRGTHVLRDVDGSMIDYEIGYTRGNVTYEKEYALNAETYTFRMR